MDSLSGFVGQRLRAGRTPPEIEAELALLGWGTEDVRQALRDALVGIGAPLPPVATQRTLERASSALDVGMSLFGFVLLAMVVGALLNLGFGLADKAFPDVLAAAGGAPLERSIHRAMAALLVAMPCYALFIRWWLRRFAAAAGRREPALTRWLTHLVLLAASVTMVGDLIATVYALLQGQASMRFALKAAWLLVLATLVGGLYLLERRQVQYARTAPRAALAAIGVTALLLALGSLGLGLRLAGTPAQARAQALDLERAQRLTRLAGCIDSYTREAGQFPASLDALLASANQSDCIASSRDPSSRRAFDYRVLSPLHPVGAVQEGSFELCADFERAEPSPTPASPHATGAWSGHRAGRVCRVITVRLRQTSPR